MLLSDRHTGEHLDHYALEAGDIVVSASGYGYRGNVATARTVDADVVVRITYQGFPIPMLHGATLAIPAWVQRGRGPVRHVAAGCAYRGQRFAVRLLALRLPPQAAREARVRATRRAQKHSRRVRAETLRMAAWVLVVTTLDEATWPTTAVARLYRARWQVELLFKRWKSLLQLDDLRVRTQAAVEAVVRLKLLAWLLQAEVAEEVRSVLATVQQPPGWGEQHGEVLSTWGLTALSLTTLRQQVQGRWTAGRVLACVGRLRRYLCSRPRRRGHQESEVRAWLEDHLNPAVPQLKVA